MVSRERDGLRNRNLSYSYGAPNSDAPLVRGGFLCDEMVGAIRF